MSSNDKSDKRTTNHITGKEAEDEFLSTLTHPLPSLPVKHKIIELNIEQAGGRSNNYDFLINNHKIEIKNNCKSLQQLPEILQIGCSSLDDGYIKHHFDNVIHAHFPSISYDDYLKNINSIKHEGCFKTIYEHKDEIEQETKDEIANYITNVLEIDYLSEQIVSRLQEQTQKLFIMKKDNIYYADEIKDNFDTYNAIIDNETQNRIIIETQNNLYYVLLRWKNSIGVNYPAYQISIKPKNKPNIIVDSNKRATKLKLKLTKEERKADGIYFTPKNIIQMGLKHVLPLFSSIIDDNNSPLQILEPSCGDGGFIREILTMINCSSNNDNYEITAYELNDKVYSYVTNLFNTEPQYNNVNINIIHSDYLKSPTNEPRYDIIVGNPPYYVTKNKLHSEYYTGRPNIFIQFIIHSLKQLKPNGVLLFIIPETFLNCIYYAKTREYIRNEYEILNIYNNPNDFNETNYSTITIIIRNNKLTNTSSSNLSSDNDSWFYNNVIIINNELKELLNHENHNYYMLSELEDVTVSVGGYVWNQHKENLTDILTDNEELPILIYGANSKRISYVTNVEEKYIETKDVVILNRGHGNSAYKLNFEYIDSNKYTNDFILENHVMVIRSENKSNLQKIYKSLQHELTQKFISLYVTNGAINVDDLTNNIAMYE